MNRRPDAFQREVDTVAEQLKGWKAEISSTTGKRTEDRTIGTRGWKMKTSFLGEYSPNVVSCMQNIRVRLSDHRHLLGTDRSRLQHAKYSGHNGIHFRAVRNSSDPR